MLILVAFFTPKIEICWSILTKKGIFKSKTMHTQGVEKGGTPMLYMQEEFSFNF